MWEIFRKSVPWILIGTFGGTYLAARMSTMYLKIVFSIFLYFAAGNMMFSKIAKPIYSMPNDYYIYMASIFVGALSSLVGIGGGIFSVPLMLYCNIRVHNAVATSAAIGFPIAVAGTVGYVLGGLNVTNLPSTSVGFVSIPALVSIICFSTITAPIGVKAAYFFSPNKLRKIFAFFLFLVGTKMLFGCFRF